MSYLLDTNILSDLVKRPHGPIAHRIAEVGEGKICTSIIVAAELQYGAAKSGSPRLLAQVQSILGVIEVLPLEVPIDAIYGRLRSQLERAGTLIGANDLLIAAHALVSDRTLVTDNQREFTRIDGLRIENWLR